MDWVRAGRARGRRIVVGMDALVPATNVFRELSQRSSGVSERYDPFGIFMVVFTHLIKVLPPVLPDTQNTAMINPKVRRELLKSVCGGWKAHHPPAIWFVKSSRLRKKQALVLATLQHPVLEPNTYESLDLHMFTQKNTSYTLLTRDGGTT